MVNVIKIFEKDKERARAGAAPHCSLAVRVGDNDATFPAARVKKQLDALGAAPALDFAVLLKGTIE